MKNKLIIKTGHSGIPPLELTITIEGNIDMKDVLKDIFWEDNEKLFVKDIKQLCGWIDDMTCIVDTIDIE